MIIDADTHLNGRGNGPGIDADELLRQMDALEVDMSISWPMVSLQGETAADNAHIYQATKAHADRIVQFGGVNPVVAGIDGAKAELAQCLDEYCVAGVKLNGARDGYYIDDPVLSLPLIDMIASAGRVLGFHCGANDFEKTHPFRVAKISEMYPDLRIMVIHMGGSGAPHMHDAVIELAAKYPNWYLIDSEADYRKINQAIDVLGASRVCYGSDTPFCPMRYERPLRDVYYQDLSPEDKSLVMGGNIARMLEL